MTTWLITGSTGLLGANAALALGSTTTTVGLGRQAGRADLFDRCVIADLSDAQALRTAVAEIRPDVILHTAALSTHEGCEANPELAHRVNAVASGELAAAAADTGAAFVYVSTDSVFDGSVGNYKETDDPNPFSVYGHSKLAGEQAVLEAMPAALIARTNFFGWSPSGTRSILEFFATAVRTGREAPGFTDFIVTSLYVADLVAVLQRLVSDGRTGVVHVTSRDALSKYAFGCEVAEALGGRTSLIRATSATNGHSMARARNLSLDTGLLQTWLGEAPSSQVEGIHRAYDEEREVVRAIRGEEGRA